MSHEPLSVTIRPAREADAAALTRVATLDSAPVPAAPVLVAEVSGEIVAAIGVDSGERIANPFEPTSEALELLALRARRLTSVAGRRSLSRRLHRPRTPSAARAA